MSQTHIKSELTNKTLSGPKMREISIPDANATSRTVQGNIDIDFDAVDALMRERNMPPVDRQAIQSQYNARQAAKRQMSEQELVDLEQQVKEARQAKLSGKERLSSGAKQRIELLCEMSRGTKMAEIDGNTYTLKTLKGKEQRAAIMAASEFDNSVESVFEIRKQLLARSLVEVAGTDIELFLGSPSMEARLDFIEELDESVLNKLYADYLLLINDVQQKYFVKNEQEAEEVIADLKK